MSIGFQIKREEITNHNHNEKLEKNMVQAYIDKHFISRVISFLRLSSFLQDGDNVSFVTL